MTLCIDIGGTGLKAAVLNDNGEIQGEISRIPTTYPMPPDKLVEKLTWQASTLGKFDRASCGFPGMVRSGVVLSAPHFVTESGPGSKIDKDLQEKWSNFDLAGALTSSLKCPTRVDNDADQQGAAVISGTGLEMVITLGTGFGTALFLDGQLSPHLEIAHQPFKDGKTYNELLGEASRKDHGNHHWSQLVRDAIELMEALTFYDHLYVGGGNAKKIKIELAANVTLVDNVSGIIGGLRLWQASSHPTPVADQREDDF